MSRSKSSQRWLQEHFKDPYVQKAKAQGLRSRAAFKLLEIQEKDSIIKPGMVVVDLGAAPGGWSQMASQWVGGTGQIFALDILEMDPLPNVHFIQGDFTEQMVLDELLAAVSGQKINLVISDMAPNISGWSSVDQPRSMYLLELAADFAQQVLTPGGTFLAKAFQGEGFDAILGHLRQTFKKVCIRKPKSSRARSKELYLLAQGFK